MKVSLIKDKKMNAVNINMTLEASNFEKLQSFIFEIDPSAEIKVSNLEFTASTQVAFFWNCQNQIWFWQFTRRAAQIRFILKKKFKIQP